MSVILDSLVKLEQSIGKLEGAAVHVEAALTGEQRDMFGGSPAAAANGNGIDAGLVAEKLDSAIAHMETVLQEGHG